VSRLSGVGLSRSPEGPQRLRQRATTRWPKSRCLRSSAPDVADARDGRGPPRRAKRDGWTKDFGPVLIAWGLVPSHSANFVVEFVRESLGRRLRSAPVNEHELQSFVRVRAGEVVEYLFDGTGLGGRSGDDSHAEWQARDVDADDPFGAVGPTVGAALVVKGHTSSKPRERGACR